MTTSTLIDDYLAKGGTITAPTKRRNRKHPISHHDMSITVTGPQHDKIKVHVARDRIQAAELWLIANGLRFRTAKTVQNSRYAIYFAAAKDAVLFKLVWV